MLALVRMRKGTNFIVQTPTLPLARTLKNRWLTQWTSYEHETHAWLVAWLRCLPYSLQTLHTECPPDPLQLLPEHSGSSQLCV